MKRSKLRRLAIGSCLALVLPASRGPVRADSIELINGTRSDNVQILSAKHKNVSYKLANAPAATSVEGVRILAIERDSQVLQSPRTALAAGDHAKALQEFTAIAQAAKGDDWQGAEAMYQIGRTHLAAGRYKEAAQAFTSYLEKYKASADWFVPAATNDLADSLLLAGQSLTAEIHYKELDKFGGQWSDLGKIGQAKAIIKSKGQAGALAARTLLDQVRNNREAAPAHRRKALVLRGTVFLLQGQPQQAIKELTDEFFSAARAAELEYSEEKAEAALLLGRAHAALGGKENLEQAELWLLRISALFSRYTRVYTAACDELAEVYGKLGNAARSKEWKERKEGVRPSRQSGSGSPPARAAGGNGKAPANGKK